MSQRAHELVAQKWGEDIRWRRSRLELVAAGELPRLPIAGRKILIPVAALRHLVNRSLADASASPSTLASIGALEGEADGPAGDRRSTPDASAARDASTPQLSALPAGPPSEAAAL